jgi:hypothetical protein
MPSYIDKQAAAALQQLDLHHWNRERYRKAKRGSVLISAMGACLILGIHFGISPIMSLPFQWGALFAACADVLIIALFGKILWKTASMTLQKPDFDYLNKWHFFELNNQRKISGATISVAGIIFLVLGLNTLFWWIALWLASIGLILSVLLITAKLLKEKRF